MAEIDALQLQRMVEALEQVNRQLEKVAGGADRATDSMAQKTERAAKRFQTAWEKAFDPKAQAVLADEYVEKWSTGFERIVATAQSKWSDFGDWMKRQGAAVVGAPGRMWRNETKAIKTGLTRLKSSILSELPFGGLMGLMMYGKMKDAEFAAKGQQAAQIFKSVGRVGQDEAQRLGGQIRRLSVSFVASLEDVMAVERGLAKFGVTSKEAGAAASFGMTGFGRNIDMVTLGLDKMFQVAAGTNAQMAGQLMVDTNISLKESVRLTRDLGFAARESGMDFQQMVGSVMQATSALRLQAVDAEKLGDITMRMQQGFQGEGMSPQRAGLLAAQAMPALAQGMMGLSLGMQGFIGQRMAAQGMGLGGDISGEEAIIRFQRGFRGTRGDESFFAQGLQQMLGMAREAAGGDPFRQELALQQMFNMAPQQSQALMAIQRDTDSGLNVQEAAAKHMDELNKAFKDQSLKTDTFTKWMARLRDAIAHIGSGLFDIMTSGFQHLILLGQMAVAKARVGPFQDLPDALWDAYIMQGTQLAGTTDKAIDSIVNALSDIGVVGQSAAGMMSGPSKATFDTEFQKIMGEEGARRASEGIRRWMSQQPEGKRSGPTSPFTGPKTDISGPGGVLEKQIEIRRGVGGPPGWELRWQLLPKPGGAGSTV